MIDTSRKKFGFPLGVRGLGINFLFSVSQNRLTPLTPEGEQRSSE